MSCKKKKSDNSLHKVRLKDGSTETGRNPRICGCDPDKIAIDSRWLGRKIKIKRDDVESIERLK